MSLKKRFIAGVVCPRCAEMDRIRAWEQNGVRYRECVNCDFFEQLPIESDTPKELETRVNRPQEASPSEEISTVKIIDPKLH